MAYVKATERGEQLVAAARRVFVRDGVAKGTLRAVATEAGVPLGTLHYIFASKELLLRAVIEDVVEEIAEVLRSTTDLGGGLGQAITHGIETFWAGLVEGDRGLQLMQYELTTYALRSAGLEGLARWQYERYCSVVASWCEESARIAGESSAVPYSTLGRVLVAGMDGLILQYVCDPDTERSRQDVKAVIDMVTNLAVRGSRAEIG